MSRFLSEIQEKYTKLAKIVKISISFNRLVFPLNFNRFSQPLTVMTQMTTVMINMSLQFALDRETLNIIVLHVKVLLYMLVFSKHFCNHTI